MASLAARTAHKVSRPCAGGVARIWTSVGGSLSSSMLQFRSYSDEGLDGRVLPYLGASSAGHVSEELPPAVPTTQSFRAYRSIFDTNSYPRRKCEGYGFTIPSVVLEFRGTGAALNEAKSPVSNHERASWKVAQESSRDSPRQGFVCGTELPFSSESFRAYRRVYDRNANPARNCDGYEIRILGTVLEFRRTQAAFNDAKSPVSNHERASSNVAQESCRETPTQGFVCGIELPIGFTCRGGNIHMPSASTKSEAIAILKHHQQQGYIDSYMFVEILKQCSKQKDLLAARQVHDCIIQYGMDKHPYVATTLLNVYIKCGRLQDAHRVFDGLQKTDRNVITWTVMIGAYAKGGCGVEAYRLFLQMKREGFTPNAITFLSILNASASAGALEWVKEVHTHALEAGLESDLRVGNALVHMYAKSGSIDDARVVFDRMEKRDVVTWNIMIGAYAESGCGVLDDARLIFDRMETRDVVTWNIMIGAYAESGCGVEAYRLFLRMKREGFIPNAITYVNILNASASVGALEWVKEVHSHVLKAGLESDLCVGNALVHMYAKSGSIDDARVVFETMEKRNVITWTTMIGGLAEHGRGHEALELFRKMNVDSVKADEITFVAVLSACSHAGLVDDGCRLFSAMMQDYGIEPTVVHYNCMVDLLGRAGLLEEANLFIGDMPVEPDAVTWGALLGACKTYGNVELGELAAKELFKLEPKDASTYVLLSNIYAAAGKSEKVSSVRTIMRKRGARKEPGRSWIQVNNKIHEFVVSDTSHPEAKAIYTELNKLTEKLKAEGYIPDTQLVLRDIAEEDKELALCSHSEKLAIAYGLISVPLGKPIRVYKNLRVCSDCHAATKLISKVTGREIIARDANRFHHFKDGMCSCGDYW